MFEAVATPRESGVYQGTGGQAGGGGLILQSTNSCADLVTDNVTAYWGSRGFLRAAAPRRVPPPQAAASPLCLPGVQVSYQEPWACQVGMGQSPVTQARLLSPLDSDTGRSSCLKWV